MHISDILKLNEQPDLYEKGNSFMWSSPHISKQLLDIHLDNNNDLASRKEATIQLTTEWILEQIPKAPQSILDLGCGPGLYCEKLSKSGHIVTGVDISTSSINYAKSKAAEQRKKITYRNADYLSLELPPNSYDLVIMIYTDLGVLLPRERSVLLQKVYNILKPGGMFIFDVINDARIKSKLTPNSWDAVCEGFWSPNPYLLLANSFYYPDEKVILYQHHVISENNQTNTYRFWTHHFSIDDIRSIIGKHKFKLLKAETNILPAIDNWSGDNITFYTIVK